MEINEKSEMETITSVESKTDKEANSKAAEVSRISSALGVSVQFKKPLLIGPRKGAHKFKKIKQQSAENKEKSAENDVDFENKIDFTTVVKKSEKPTAEMLAENTIPVPYKEPKWSGFPTRNTFKINTGEERIVIGSHSSKLSCIQPDSGHEIWTTYLGDRIQSDFRPTRDGSKGFIGCYDHYVYCITTSDGGVQWKFKTGDVVKSTPCLSTDERIVYVGSYDKNLYCLSVAEGQLISSLKLSEGGIFCSGIVSDSPNNFYTGTLDGVCVAINQKTNQLVWKTALKSPVFACPCKIFEKNEIIFSEVLGTVHGLNALNGDKLWEFKADGNIYSSPIRENLNGVNYIFFGCHDAHLYCLKYEGELELEWKQKMASSVFAKPAVVLESLMVCAALTKGTICLCDFLSGSIKAQFQLDGEIFSSPVYSNNRLVFGCRDNCVYCLDISKTYCSE